MNQIQYEVQVLKARFITHQRETDDFTWNFQEATTKEILDTTPVSKDTLDGLSNVILKIIIPKSRAKLRRQIAYLIGLQQRQAEAWEWYIKDCQERTDNVNKWIETHQQKETWATQDEQ